VAKRHAAIPQSDSDAQLDQSTADQAVPVPVAHDPAFSPTVGPAPVPFGPVPIEIAGAEAHGDPIA